MSGLSFVAIAALVRSAFAEVTAEQAPNGQPFLRVPPALVPVVLQRLRDDAQLACDALMDLTAWDTLGFPGESQGQIAVVYLLWSHRHRHAVTVEVRVDRQAAAVPSVAQVWPAARYFEREVFDLYGVQFQGHPDLRRILCPEDWLGHALRKDYLYPAEYHGVSHLRDGQHFDGGPRRVGDAAPAVPPAAAPHGGGKT